MECFARSPAMTFDPLNSRGFGPSSRGGTRPLGNTAGVHLRCCWTDRSRHARTAGVYCVQLSLHGLQDSELVRACRRAGSGTNRAAKALGAILMRAKRPSEMKECDQHSLSGCWEENSPVCLLNEVRASPPCAAFSRGCSMGIPPSTHARTCSVVLLAIPTNSRMSVSLRVGAPAWKT